MTREMSVCVQNTSNFQKYFRSWLADFKGVPPGYAGPTAMSEFRSAKNRNPDYRGWNQMASLCRAVEILGQVSREQERSITGTTLGEEPKAR